MLQQIVLEASSPSHQDNILALKRTSSRVCLLLCYSPFAMYEAGHACCGDIIVICVHGEFENPIVLLSHKK